MNFAEWWQYREDNVACFIDYLLIVYFQLFICFFFYIFIGKNPCRLQQFISV